MTAARLVRLYAASLLVGCLLMAAGDSEARAFRVNQIPNGTSVPNTANNACLTCHNGQGGGPRNAFGLAVQALVQPGANTPFWSPSLAAQDSDGDGASNGLELQDPNGTWQPGQPAPGDPSLVTHPGNASSVPAQLPTPTPGPTVTPTPTPIPEPSSPGNAFVAVLTGDQEVPPVQTDATGFAAFRLHEPERVLYYWLSVSDLQNQTAAHIHLGAPGVSGGVRYPLVLNPNGFSEGELVISAEDVASLKSGLLYANVHSTQNPNGEIRGQIEDRPVRLKATLTGNEEVPPVNTAATGVVTFEFDEDLGVVSYDVTLQNITNVTMAHIHEGLPGESGPVEFPIADAPFTTKSGDIELEKPEQFSEFLEGIFYFNVHTTQNPEGEIRGQILFDGSEQTTIRSWSLF